METGKLMVCHRIELLASGEVRDYLVLLMPFYLFNHFGLSGFQWISIYKDALMDGYWLWFEIRADYSVPGCRGHMFCCIWL